MIFTNDQIRFDEIKKLKRGDIVYECANFIGTWICQLISDPEEFIDEGGYHKVRWRCKTGRIGVDMSVDSAQEQDYVVTKGFEHYGPQIYKELLVRDKDGNFSNYFPKMS